MKIKFGKKGDDGNLISQEMDVESVESVDGFVPLNDLIAEQKAFEDFKRDFARAQSVPISAPAPAPTPRKKQSLFEKYIDRRLSKW